MDLLNLQNCKEKVELQKIIVKIYTISIKDGKALINFDLFC